jgi:hypothetical protein
MECLCDLRLDACFNDLFGREDAYSKVQWTILLGDCHLNLLCLFKESNDLEQSEEKIEKKIETWGMKG